MADRPTAEKEQKSCSHCGDELGSQEALQWHMDKCKMAPDTSWIKKEPWEETPLLFSSSQANLSVCDIKTEPHQSQVTSGIPGPSSQAMVCGCEIKTEPLQTLPAWKGNPQTAISRPSGQEGQAGERQNNVLQPVLTSQPELHKPQTSETTAGGYQMVQLSAVRLPLQLTVSPKYHDANKKLTAYEMLRHHVRKKKPATPNSMATRNLFILPKTTNETVSSSDADVPKIDKVFYTSKAASDHVGQIRVASDAFHPPPLTKEFNLALSKQKDSVKGKELANVEMQSLTLSAPPSLTSTFIQSQSKSEPKVTVSVGALQQTMPQTVPASQGLQYASQDVQQMAASLLPAPLGLPQGTQSLLPGSQALLQNQQGILQNSQNVLGQFLPQSQNMILLQPAVQNVTRPSVIPLFTPQHISVQQPASGINVLPTHSSSVPLPAGISHTKFTNATSSPTTSTVTADRLPQGQALKSGHKPSSLETSRVQTAVVQSKPVVPVSLPLVSLPQMVGGINQVYSSLQTKTILSNPAGSNLIWLPGSTNQDGCQNVTQFQAPVTTTPLLVTGTPLSPGLGRINAVASVPAQHSQAETAKPTSTGIILLQKNPGSNSLQNSGHLQIGAQQSKIAVSAPGGVNVSASVVKQNHVSNVVLLPPVISQGYILNGIRIQSPIVPKNENSHIGTQKNVGSRTVQMQSSASISSPKGTQTPTAAPRASSVSDHQSHKACLSPAQKGKVTKYMNNHVVLETQSTKANEKTCEKDADTVGRAEKDELPSLTLMFSVKGSVDHHTAAGIIVLVEYKVANIARLILSGTIKEPTPVILDDGRPFLPISYTGPYKPKRTKTFVKNKESDKPRMTESNETNIIYSAKDERSDSVASTSADGSKKSKDTFTTVQTIKLLGNVVWLFLDFDGPKILWKIVEPEKRVLALPLKKRFSLKLVKEIRGLLSKFRLTIPPSVDTFFTRSAKRKVNSNKQPVSLTENTESSHSQACQKHPGIGQGRGSLPPNMTPAVQERKSFSAAPESNRSTKSASTSHGREVAEPKERKHGRGSHTTGKKSKQEHGSPLTPQLLVRENAAVVQRALEAVVRVERIALTDSLQQQLKSYLEGKDADTGLRSLESDSLEPQDERKHSVTVHRRRGRKPNWLKRLGRKNAVSQRAGEHQMPNVIPEDVLKKKRPENQRGQDSDSGSALESDQIPAHRNSICEASELAEQKLLVENVGYHDTQKNTGVQSMNNMQDQTHSRRKRREGVFKSEWPGFVSDGNPGAEMRRSFRILCKPKPDYSLQEQRYDYMEEDNETLVSEAEEGRHVPRRAKKKKGHSPVAKPKSTVHISTHVVRDSQSMKKVLEVDVYTDKADRAEKDGTRHLQPDDDHDKDTDMHEQDEEEKSLPADKFLQRHTDDFKELVLKKAKTNQAGLRGHILYLCVICGSFQSRSMEELAIHLKQHYSGELSCKICKFRAAHKQELIEHEALEHTGKPLYHCQVCQTPFFSQAVFQSHKKRHEASTECTVCRVNFPNEIALHIHRDKEHSKKFECHLCNMVLPNEEGLRSHYRHCIDGYQCCFCHIKKPTASEVQRHVKEDHGHQGVLQICSFEHCGASFQSVEELGSHTAMHVNTLYTRREQVKIFRLRTGHNRLLHHMHTKFGIGQSGECPSGEGPLTTDHILQVCTTYAASRRKYWPTPTAVEAKLYSTLEKLRWTAVFIEDTGLLI